MRRLLIFALLVAACGGGKVAPSSRTIFVAPLGRDGGNDSNDGTTDHPFATIQKALSVAQSGDTISVRAGTYGVGGTGLPSSPGDSFPLRLKPGVSLVGSGTSGDTASVLQATQFSETPAAVVIMAEGARLEAFQIDAASGVGVYSEAPIGAIVSNAIQRGTTGVRIVGGSVAVQDNLLAAGAGAIGALIEGGTPAFTGNRIVRNLVGVRIAGGTPAFARNSLGCNSQGEMENQTSAVLDARDNMWFPFPPPRVSGGPVDTTGGSLGNC